MSTGILKISEAATIALHALMLLAKNPDKLHSVKEMAEVLDVSANHLSKVMQRLCKAGLTKSIKGFNGGFELLVRAEDVTFIEIYELFDGKLRTSNCLLDKDPCRKNCIFGELVASITEQVKEKFSKTTLADLIK